MRIKIDCDLAVTLTDFPRELELSQKVPFTELTHKDLFSQAVKSHIPYYTIAIAGSTDGNMTTYSIHEGSQFYKKMCKEGNPQGQAGSYTTVHYFALSCFTKTRNDLWTPVAIKKGAINQIKFISLSVNGMPQGGKEEALDRVFIDSVALGGQSKQRVMQAAIAKCVKAGKLLFGTSQLDGEWLKWNWCAAQTTDRNFEATAAIANFWAEKDEKPQAIAEFFSSVKTDSQNVKGMTRAEELARLNVLQLIEDFHLDIVPTPPRELPKGLR